MHFYICYVLLYWCIICIKMISIHPCVCLAEWTICLNHFYIFTVLQFLLQTLNLIDTKNYNNKKEKIFNIIKKAEKCWVFFFVSYITTPYSDICLSFCVCLYIKLDSNPYHTLISGNQVICRTSYLCVDCLDMTSWL